MKKKLFTVVLSTMVVLGGAGNALAAESCADVAAVAAKGLQIPSCVQTAFTKYFCGAGVWMPGASGGITLPELEMPEADSKPENDTQQETTQNGTQQNGSVQQGGSQQAQVISLVNKERSAAGLSSLSSDSQLAAVAQKKAEDMAKNGYFSHTSPTYGSAFDMLKAAGISYRTAGENIAKGQKSAESVMNGWMNSSGHRANILSGSYTRIGVGYAVDGNGTPYWVQIFAG